MRQNPTSAALGGINSHRGVTLRSCGPLSALLAYQKAAVELERAAETSKSA